MRYRWLIVSVIVAMVAVTPFLKADRFGPRIHAELESALGRKVEIGAVRVSLFPNPGFSVRNVVIHEDAAVSAEPFAYVGNLVVSLRWLSLVQGRVAISSLRLEDPSLNLMRNGDGVWNLESWRRQAGAKSDGGAAGVGGNQLPELEVRRGRINFKLEDTKSVYYFTETDIDFSEVEGGNFDIWFVGEPARTDRKAQGFGRMTARGRLRAGDGAPRLDLDVRVEESALEEMSVLLAGYDVGVHGAVLGQAQISGVLPDLTVAGRLEFAELHHWSQPPRAGGIGMEVRGKFDYRGQLLELQTEKQEPFGARLRMRQFMTAPEWELELTAKELGLSPAADWFRPSSEEFNGMKLTGSVTGRLAIHHDKPAEGEAALHGLEWTWGTGNSLSAETIGLAFGNGETAMRPAAMTLNGDALQGECTWAVRGDRWECKGSSRGLQVVHLNTWAKGIGLSAPVAAELLSGQMRGSMSAKYENGEAQWRGVWELRNAELAAPEFAEKVKVKSAVVQLQPARVVVQPIEASVGKLEWKGSYRYEESAARPNRVEVDLDSADVEELERLMLPALQRSRGFLARTLGIGEDRVPEWLAGRRAEARFRVGKLRAGALQIESVSGRAEWDADRLAITGLTGMFEEGRLEAAGVIRLRGAGPEYEFSGKLANWQWASGMVDAEWKLRTKGMGRDWLNNLAAEGRVTATGVELDGLSYEELRSGFRIDMSKQGAAANLEEPAAMAAGVKMLGKVLPQRDGQMIVEFSGEGKELRLAGRLRPLSVRTAGPGGSAAPPKPAPAKEPVAPVKP